MRTRLCVHIANAQMAAIASWSGKENWPEQAEQSEDWPTLDPRWLADSQTACSLDSHPKP